MFVLREEQEERSFILRTEEDSLNYSENRYVVVSSNVTVVKSSDEEHYHSLFVLSKRIRLCVCCFTSNRQYSVQTHALEGVSETLRLLLEAEVKCQVVRFHTKGNFEIPSTSVRPDLSFTHV